MEVSKLFFVGREDGFELFDLKFGLGLRLGLELGRCDRDMARARNRARRTDRDRDRIMAQVSVDLVFDFALDEGVVASYMRRDKGLRDYGFKGLRVYGV